MTDPTVAACRAALLTACDAQTTFDIHGDGTTYVDVDDAAACMAEREQKLVRALTLCMDARAAALAAAQGGPDE